MAFWANTETSSLNGGDLQQSCRLLRSLPLHPWAQIYRTQAGVCANLGTVSMVLLEGTIEQEVFENDQSPCTIRYNPNAILREQHL